MSEHRVPCHQMLFRFSCSQWLRVPFGRLWICWLGKVELSTLRRCRSYLWYENVISFYRFGSISTNSSCWAQNIWTQWSVNTMLGDARATLQALPCNVTLASHSMIFGFRTRHDTDSENVFVCNSGWMIRKYSVSTMVADAGARYELKSSTDVILAILSRQVFF